MNKTTLIILICVGVFVLFVGSIILIRIFNSRHSKKLQDNLKKFKQEKEELDQGDNISLSSDNNTQLSNEMYIPESKTEEFNFPENTEASVEEYEPFLDVEQNQPIPKNEFDFFGENSNTSRMQNLKDDDFEKFMDEHSYSRKIIAPSLLDKLKSLPPEVRMLLLSNVLDKFHDE